MPLFFLDEAGNSEQVEHVPHPETWALRERLSSREDEAILDALSGVFDRALVSNERIVTSSWVPGSDWTDSPYQPIFEATRQDFEVAGWLFGLYMWYVAMNRPEDWACTKGEGDIRGTHYWSIHDSGGRR